MKVLVVEDEEAYVDALTIGLTKEGFEVVVASDGAEALKLFEQIDPDIVLLDWMLPRLSGVEVCKEIRTKSRVPIIMLTAKGSEIDTVVGLEVGADDYVSKPYRMRELIARMRAVLRRTEEQRADKQRADKHRADKNRTEEGDVDGSVAVGDVVLDPDRHEIRIRGESVGLPLKEYDLLYYLMVNAGRVLSRDQLIEKVWGFDYFGDTKTLDVHIKRLRDKVELTPSEPSRIVTVRGVGYKYTSRERLAEQCE